MADKIVKAWAVITASGSIICIKFDRLLADANRLGSERVVPVEIIVKEES